MKKTYKNPTMEIVKIASQTQIMAGSGEKSLGGSKGDYSSSGGISFGGHEDDNDW